MDLHCRSAYLIKCNFFKEGNKSALKAIDDSSAVKNKWSWKWPDEVLKHSFLKKIGLAKYTLRECIRKIDVAGVTWCLWCKDKITYGNNGKKHLIDHCGSNKHLVRLKVRPFQFRSTCSQRPESGQGAKFYLYQNNCESNTALGLHVIGLQN